MKIARLVFLMLAISSCSTAKVTSRSPIPFETISHLPLGKVTSEEVRRMFGSPDEEVELKREFSGKVSWTFNEKKDGENFQRLGLLIDKKTGTVELATWATREGEELHKKETALSHFKDSSFKVVPAGRVAPDYYSDEATYADPRLGISLDIEETRQIVRSVSFSPLSQGSFADHATQNRDKPE